MVLSAHQIKSHLLSQVLGALYNLARIDLFYLIFPSPLQVIKPWAFIHMALFGYNSLPFPSFIPQLLEDRISLSSSSSSKAFFNEAFPNLLRSCRNLYIQ